MAKWRNNKAVIVSAPSGAGKTTIVKHLLASLPQLEFSVSACSRLKRQGETDGKDYFFITADSFREKIARDEFVEWQEVYPGSYYGTLKPELERIWKSGKTPIFDVDVQGGLNLKKYFGKEALCVFIRPPSLEILIQRLRSRGTESEESLFKRIGKAESELAFSKQFDLVIINDELDIACCNLIEQVRLFIS
ncbi:MAG: guanylate kinase [Bacteroidales bacterium]|nr:guanylate kinase [Bacteroidales bacterium]MDD4603487.1 guanylate kinase [Bacteroidales bacterium]